MLISYGNMYAHKYIYVKGEFHGYCIGHGTCADETLPNVISYVYPLQNNMFNAYNGSVVWECAYTYA